LQFRQTTMRWGRRGFRLARALVVAFATPLLEKNPTKTLSVWGRRVPFVFSMARLIVLAFAVAMLHQAWRAGIAGWPEATLSMAIVLALPVLGALERVRPADTVALARSLLGRFGTGSGRQVGSLFGHPPSKYDDHRDDGLGGGQEGAA
jgi:hypothetical protein